MFIAKAIVLLSPLLLTSPVRSMSVERDTTATTLFREETLDAAKKLNWKGPALSEETRFAVAATGLSWNPQADGVSIIRKEGKLTQYVPAETRYQSFMRIQKGSQKKEAFAAAMSLLLNPERNDAYWQAGNSYLEHYGEEVDKALIGILQAPTKLPLLSEYQYSAMDCLTRRATFRLFPLFCTLAESSDRYLRSRAIAALGIIHSRPATDRVTSQLLNVPLRANSISAVQSRTIMELIHDAATDKNWRVRCAAALAIGLIHDEADVPLLEKLAKDSAYLSAGTKNDKSVHFPVRAQADASLSTFGRSVTLPIHATGKDASKAARGGKDVTNDRSDVRPDQESKVKFIDAEW